MDEDTQPTVKPKIKKAKDRVKEPVVVKKSEKSSSKARVAQDSGESSYVMILRTRLIFVAEDPVTIVVNKKKKVKKVKGEAGKIISL